MPESISLKSPAACSSSRLVLYSTFSQWNARVTSATTSDVIQNLRLGHVTHFHYPALLGSILSLVYVKSASIWFGYHSNLGNLINVFFFQSYELHGTRGKETIVALVDTRTFKRDPLIQYMYSETYP